MARPSFRVAFVGATPASLAERIRPHLKTECEFLHVDERGVIGVLPDVDILISFVFTKEMGAAARRLRLLQVPGAGLDRIDLSAVPTGSLVANAYGHENGIAEYVVGAMLALSRGFLRVDRTLREGRWEGSWMASAPPWPELVGKTLGLLGYGRIGERVAQFARAFGMEVRAIRRRPRPAESSGLAFLGAPEDLERVLERADFLVIALPLTPETRGLLGERQLRLMKRTAFLVNVARAEIVDEVALYEGLKSRLIAGAALDVWGGRPDLPRPRSLPPPAERPHDAPPLRVDGGDPRGARQARRGEHRPTRPRRAPAEPCPLPLTPRFRRHTVPVS